MTDLGLAEFEAPDKLENSRALPAPTSPTPEWRT